MKEEEKVESNLEINKKFTIRENKRFWGVKNMWRRLSRE